MIEDISPHEFVQRCDADVRWQLIDVREPWETDTVSLSRAIAMPMLEIPGRLAELDRSRPLAILCHSGIRSRKVAEFLSKNGFEKVVNIAGGINAWAEDLDPSLARY